ncbi:MAG: L-seryl-tRNA(Sec) selenium transferase [Acidimicrobiia bacterium]
MERRQLPAVDQFVTELGKWPLSRAAVVDVARAVIAEARAGEGDSDLVSRARERLEGLVADRLHPVLNATGVLLHTNLGRAPLAAEAAAVAAKVATGYANVELDMRTGARGQRSGSLHALLADLTGAEAALAVNNNAAALVLVLAALAKDREVMVSRGELIEIGGSYRLPEIIAAGGATLREVGTTNRTRMADYSSALGGATACLLKVHPSNYRITGFSEEASLKELVGLGREHRLPVVFDAGSGLLDENVPWWGGPPPAWLNREPGVRQSIAAGADLLLFSGDKLFGGPQAGVIVGNTALVEKVARHPLARAFRLDGPTAAALAATAEMYADGRGADVPLWAMARVPYQVLESRLQHVLERSAVPAQIEEGPSVLGAGSVPGASIPSPVMVIEGEVDRLFARLLAGSPAVLGRREAGRLLVDLRAIPQSADEALAAALAAAWRS